MSRTIAAAPPAFKVGAHSRTHATPTSPAATSSMVSSLSECGPVCERISPRVIASSTIATRAASTSRPRSSISCSTGPSSTPDSCHNTDPIPVNAARADASAARRSRIPTTSSIDPP